MKLKEILPIFVLSILAGCVSNENNLNQQKQQSYHQRETFDDKIISDIELPQDDFIGGKLTLSETIYENVNQATPHPYPNYYDDTIVIRHSGAEKIQIHFSYINVESYYDYVYIYDASDTLINQFSGHYQDIWTAISYSDTINVRLVSDYSITAQGFEIDQISFAMPVEESVEKVAAIAKWSASRLYFFNNSGYIKFNFFSGQAFEGYPRNTANFWPGLWSKSADTIVNFGNGKLYFFKGSEYIRYDMSSDRVDSGYPRDTATYWEGLGSESLDAGFYNEQNGKIYFFRGDNYYRYNLSTDKVDYGYPRKIIDYWPGIWDSNIDAIVQKGSKVYFFKGSEYIRYDLDYDQADSGYPRSIKYYWPGLWDDQNGSGHPGANLPNSVKDLLYENPSASEIAARKARVYKSTVGTSYTDISSKYPEYLASIEDRLKTYGCGLLKKKTSATYRFRCATHTQGPQLIDIEPYKIEYIDWSIAKYHISQTSQGDFMADIGTPITILKADDDEFYIHSISSNRSSGSISSGLNIKVLFYVNGVKKVFGFSHLNTIIPRYVQEAQNNGTALETGTVFGFIGYTGNLWIGSPPSSDRPYSGNGAGLPAAHSHIWFSNGSSSDYGNHKKMAGWAREAIDYSGTYYFGGG